jgi:hypothetical protein
MASPAPASVMLHAEQFHVYHLRRSGGHGLIDWVFGHHAGPKAHFNQVNRYVRSGWFRPQQTVHLHGDPTQRAFELISCEDLPLNILATLPPPRYSILLLRDPFNTFASRLQMVRNATAEGYVQEAMLVRADPLLWKQYAREYVEPRYLPRALRVNYNRWYTDAAYRENLAAQLGWTFTDQGFGSKVGWRFSGGSSFREKDPRNLDILGRWTRFRDDPEFLDYFDDEIRALSRRIFEWAAPI